jgi:hypothetical protein
VDTQTSLVSCGSCDNYCASGLICSSGECVCEDETKTLCGTSCVDVSSDATNCGACGTVCGLGESCVSGSCECMVGSVSFANDIQPIFTQSCTGRGCHAGARAAENLSLEAGKSYDALVNVASDQCSRTRVVPGDPAASYVMSKLENVDMCFGTQMPKVNEKLTRDQLDKIASWICSGAENN